MKKLIVLIGTLGVALFGQAPPADIPQTTIRTATHMVVVDVIVSDKAGNAVTGLQSTDFSVREGWKRPEDRSLPFRNFPSGGKPLIAHSTAKHLHQPYRIQSPGRTSDDNCA